MKRHALYQVSLKVFLKNSAGEVLLLKAPNGGTLAGYYDFPGGRIDESEFDTSLMEIASRELFEEIGDIEFSINPKPVATGRHFLPSRSGESNGNHLIYLFFEADYLGGKITISDEHVDHRWVKLEEVKLDDFFISGFLDAAKMYLGK